MNRIDEALQRADATARTGPGQAKQQSQFAPAWSVTGSSAPDEPTTTLEDVASTDFRNSAGLRLSSAWRERIANAPDGDPFLIEQFRRLAATLHQEQRTRGLRSVMVTSAGPGDGKTLTAINLAIVLAQSYRYKVLLIDADLRRPSIPNVVEVGHGTGLSEALRSKTEQKLALIQLGSNLTLLPAGQPISNSVEALTSPRMRVILEEATARFDWVVLDAPPVGLTSDAKLLTELVEGTLLVIRAGQTQYAAVRKGIEALGGEQAILGVVLNGTEKDPGEPYYYAYGAATVDQR